MESNVSIKMNDNFNLPSHQTKLPKVSSYHWWKSKTRLGTTFDYRIRNFFPIGQVTYTHRKDHFSTVCKRDQP
ncbi:unnamed protein product [Dovyalis caffra]|uniref:Uncharacterized protein n=1 Tax=Dovyalis caffra TaxID=77055 RepID=A0AAV1SS07_9ROSI|nr:unnamed protein product [Dovyalis caffra]